MTPRQRLLAALRGEPVDRVPYSPFLAYYWEKLPPEEQDAGQVSYLEGLGADPLLRGRHDQNVDGELALFTVSRPHCEIRETVKGGEMVTEYITPVGTLRSRHVYAEVSDTWFLVDHPVSTPEDFKTLIYLNQDTQVVPDQAKYIAERERFGERALHLPLVGTERKTSFESLLEHWVGPEELVYALADYPEVVEECLEAMRAPALESVKVSADSVAEAFIFWEDTSTTLISPDWYQDYIRPEINAWADLLHDAGKLLTMHACGYLKALLPLLADTRIDSWESISPPPTGDVTIREARAALPDRIGLIGGVEPTALIASDAEELTAIVADLLTDPGPRFILANSDSCPPEVTRDKLALIGQLVRQGAGGALA